VPRLIPVAGMHAAVLLLQRGFLVLGFSHRLHGSSAWRPSFLLYEIELQILRHRLALATGCLRLCIDQNPSSAWSRYVRTLYLLVAVGKPLPTPCNSQSQV